MSSIIDQLLTDNSDDSFFKKMTERPKPPLGVYLQWYIKDEKIKEFSGGSAGLVLSASPLSEQDNPNSARDRMGVLHTLFFPKKGDEAQGIKDQGSMISWLEPLDATGLTIEGLGKLPPRARWAKGSKVPTIDGVRVSEDEAKRRNDVERPTFVRNLIRKILLDAKENGGEGLSGSYFKGYALYAQARLDDKTGEYVNLSSSHKAGGARVYTPFLSELPAGEKFTGV